MKTPELLSKDELDTLRRVFSRPENGTEDAIRRLVAHVDALQSLSAKLPDEEVKRIAEKLNITLTAIHYDKCSFIEGTPRGEKSVDELNFAAIKQAILEALSLVRGGDAELMEDKKRLDWLEQNTTLHKEVEMLYLVDCYEVTQINDRNGSQLSHRGDTLRTAISTAMGKETK